MNPHGNRVGLLRLLLPFELNSILRSSGLAVVYRLFTHRTVGTRIKVIPSFGKGTLPTLVLKVGGPQGYPSDLSPGVS